jgi:hypothetical protein
MRTSLCLAIVVGLLAAAGCDDGEVTSCGADQQRCGNTCVTVSNDHNNCGGCNNVCGVDQQCVDSACTCSGALTVCGQQCVALGTFENCSACGDICAGSERCIDGECRSVGSEICNNEDDDGDGEIDNGIEDRECTTSCGTGMESCVAGEWRDCTAREPATEVCDEEDNDCDGEIDDGVTATFYRDGDGDRYGSETDTVQACEAPTGYVDEAGDCDDDDDALNPGETEACDGIDNDCDGTPDNPTGGCTCTLGATRNCGEGGDTGACEWGTQRCVNVGAGPVWGDCEGGVRPAAEACDDADNDCDGSTDEGMAGDAYEANESCAAARGPFVIEEDAGASPLEASLYSTTGTQDQDWFHTYAEEANHWLDCLGDVTDQCFLYLATLELPPGADHTQWELCIQDRTLSDPVCGTPDGEYCTDETNWNDAAGRYEMALQWQGACDPIFTDSKDLYLVVRRAGATLVNDCAPYTLSAEFQYTLGICPEI